MIVVRVLKDGHALREHVFTRLPVSIGRAETCDLPLADASVSRLHARIEERAQGGLELVDAGSRNGIVVGGAPVERLALAGATRARLGALELELDVLDDTPTLEFRFSEAPPSEGRRALHPLLALGLAVAVTTLSAALEPSFWSPTKTDRVVMLLTIALVALILLPLLATALFVVYKVFGRKVRWADPLQALALLTLVFPVADVVGLASYYVLSAGGREALQTLLGIATSVFAVVVLAGVKRSRPHLAFRLAWGSAALAVILGSMWIAGLSARKNGEPSLDFYVQAPLLGWPGRAQSFESYEERVRAAAKEARGAADLVRQEQQRD